jgi:hypothetical protein
VCRIRRLESVSGALYLAVINYFASVFPLPLLFFLPLLRQFPSPTIEKK